jgi:sarcosine oxidase, subunit gamma
MLNSSMNPVAKAISQSPLHHYSGQQSPAWPGQPVLQIQENALLGYINVRGLPSEPVLQQALQSQLQLSLPTQANTVSTSADGSVTAYWLGPDEHLLTLPGSNLGTLCVSTTAALHQALQGHELSVVELSGSYTQLALTGEGVRDVLARGCPLDLHPRAFAPGQCAQTHLAKAPVLLHCVAASKFKLVVRRSFALYLATWLDDARA